MFEGRSSSLVRAAASGWSGLWVMAALVIPGLLAPRPFAPRPFVPRPLAQEPPVTKRVECREWHDCRQLALDAFAQGDYERFHDLAWRTVQIGPPRNAELMYLLARAQSLSGRAHDALVMLGRLVEMAVTTGTRGPACYIPGVGSISWTSMVPPDSRCGCPARTSLSAAGDSAARMEYPPMMWPAAGTGVPA